MSYDLLRRSGVTVSFSTTPTAILPQTYTAVQVEGVLNYALAIGVDDITARYQQMMPYIEGIDSDFTKAEYVVIKHASGEREVLALAWIIESSIVSTEVRNKRVMIYGVDSLANQKIARALAMMQYNDFTIEDV